MQELARIKTDAPFNSKPLWTWAVAASTLAALLLMFGCRATEAGEEKQMENYPQWNLPEKAEARLGKGGIGTIRFSPDGTQLVVGNTIGVWIYDVATGNEISLFPGRSNRIAYAPDGRFIATNGGDPITSFGGSPLEKGAMLWDTSTRSEVPLQDALPAAAILRFSNDSSTLVSLSLSRDTIYRVDVETGETTTTKMAERPGYKHLENYALTEDKIAIGNRDGKLEVWNTKTGKKLATLRELGHDVRMPNYFVEKNRALSLKFSPDGTRLATGNLDTTVQLWDTTTGEELIVFQKPIEDNIWRLSRQNGKTVVENPMKNERNGRPRALAFSPDGSLLACGSEDGTVKLWNSVTGKLIATFTGHLSTVHQLTFSPDGNTLASGSADGTVRFWNIKNKKPIQNQIAGHLWTRTAALLNDDSTLVSVSSNGIISVWDLKNSEKTTFKTKATLEEPLYWNTYRTLVLSPDGTKLANRGEQNDPSKPNYGNVLRLTDVHTGRELAAFPNSGGEVFSPDGKILASRGGNKIRLLNTQTRENREIITSDHDEDSDDIPLVRTVAFSPDGKKIVSGTMGGQVQIWDVETGTELSAFFEELPPKGNSYQEPILNLAISSDSSLIAVGSTERIRLIGRAKQSHFKEVPYTHQESGETFIFSPDNTILIVGYWGGKIRLWDITTGNLRTTLDGHSVSVENLSFSYDNKTLVSVGGSTILFWNWNKVLASTRTEDQAPEPEVNLPTKAHATEDALQFLEHSSHPAKTTDQVLTKGEVYLANEWYEEAFVEFTKNLTAADYPNPRDENVTTSPSFQRKLFAKIGKAGKDIQDKTGYTDMLNQMIALFPDSLSIQFNAHLVLAKFYHDNDMFEKADTHIQKIDAITSDLPTEDLNFQLDANLSMAEYYHSKGIIEKAAEHIQKIDAITAELPANNPSNLKLQLNTNFSLAEYYRDKGMLEKTAEHIQKTGFVTENAWKVLGPFDNAGGIGYDTAYIPEDLTAINLNAKYDGMKGQVSWKQFNDDKLDGYIHLGEKNVDWQVSYVFTTVTSPDAREVQFRFDSDDQGTVWVNGKQVFTHTKTFAAIIDRFTIPVMLKPGKNSILVKVCNEQGGWGFYLRITDPNGQPFDDLKINNSGQD